MCGIIGVINGSQTIKPKLGTVFDDMLWADQLRGTDGAGVFWFDSRSDKYSTLKDEDIEVVRNSKDYRAALSWIEKMPFVVGHNRSATRGSVSSENNHPFDEGNVVLVHNGTMSHIPKEYDDGTQVDSHAIAKMLHHASPQEFMKKSFGAFALVWFDKLSRQLNILRNNQRPLYLVHFKDFILISSEAMLAAWCGSRNGHGYERIEEVKEHTLYQYSPFNIKEPIITDLSALKAFPHEPVMRRSRYNDLYDDEQTDYEGWWSHHNPRPYKEHNVILLPHAIDSLTSNKNKFAAINPWTYFEGIHHLPANTGEKANGSFVVKKGDWIEFIVEGGQEHGTFTHFVGKLPNKDIKSYCVRGNVAMTLDEITDVPNPWIGQVSEIKTKHNQVTLYVKEAAPVELPPAEETISEKQQQG